MKRKGLLILLTLTISYVFICQMSWHINRNIHNILPQGNLTQIDTQHYDDEKGLIWELQPHYMNLFHQPEKKGKLTKNVYPNMDHPPKIELENPNLKLLSRTKDGASYEAILQPNGTYLITGQKQGTYNYGHPNEITGMIKHVFLDVLPHFITSKYH